MIEQTKDIAKNAANNESSYYDRGINWNKEDVDIKGQQWQSAHLPVWLYSFYEENNTNGKLHFIAVNGRTKETSGSIPYSKSLINTIQAISSIICLILGCIFIKITSLFLFIIIFITIIFFFIRLNYNTSHLRHKHEVETKKTIYNVHKQDTPIKNLVGVTNSKMQNANNRIYYGNNFNTD